MVANRFKKKKKGIIRRFAAFMFYTKQFGSFRQNFGTPWARMTTQVQRLFDLDIMRGEPETFDNATARLGLTEKDLEIRRKGYLINAIFLFLLGLFFGVVGIYLIYTGFIAAGLSTQLFTFICFCCALYMHFWFFQLKHRKLGCTLKEWWDDKIIAENS